MTEGDTDPNSTSDSNAGVRAGATVVAAVLLVAVGALAPSLAGAAPANEVPVTAVSQSEASSLDDPAAAAWNDVEPTSVALSSAPSNAPNASETAVERVNVRTARNGSQLFVRLSWQDDTRDANGSGEGYEAPRVDDFGDSAAIQFPANASEEPGIAMGSQESQVNVWWWNGRMGSEELLAGGPGTATKFPNSTVASNATYRDGQWHVVFVRDLTTAGENRTQLQLDRDVSVAFAVWEGSNAERGGRKAVSDWQYLPFGPGPQGPPYETVLWTVAGLAVVIVAVVTVLAVQRGGE